MHLLGRGAAVVDAFVQVAGDVAAFGAAAGEGVDDGADGGGAGLEHGGEGGEGDGGDLGGMHFWCWGLKKRIKFETWKVEVEAENNN